MAKILGIDLGTNSIGLAVRNTDNGNTIEKQLEFFRSVIFKSGVGTGKQGEFSYAAARTSKRTTRNCLKARRQRIWATLKVLIEHNLCPLSEEGLKKWSRYDKKSGYKREYPTDEPLFEQWVRLDFNNDGKPDYSNPFEIRKELAERKFDLNDQTQRYIFGRAIYHIAQHRGFKSSKGDTLKEQEQNEISDKDIDSLDALKKSEETKSKMITDYMKEHGLHTVGQASAMLLSEGTRVRDSEFNAVRSQLKEELKYIFDKQDISSDDPLRKAILSEKKGEGTIFYKRPLRSQKGLVGKCTFEKNKPRCPISHPEYEKFRAFCFVNNIKYRKDTDSEWQTLTIDKKQRLLEDNFFKFKRKYFKFESIRKWLENCTGWNFKYMKNVAERTINYPDDTSVSGCPVTARLIDLLGDEWETKIINTSHERVNRKSGEIHRVTYNYEDIWHLCFMASTADEPEKIIDVARDTLSFDDDNIKKIKALYNSIDQGYAQICLKAIKNINIFLEQGFIYSHAVLLAKLPEIFAEKWESCKSDVYSDIVQLSEKHSNIRQLYHIANDLISKYKSLDENHRFAFKNYNYILDYDDFKDIDKAITGVIRKSVYSKLTDEQKNTLRNDVAKLYQDFFVSRERDYYKVPRLIDYIADNLSEKYSIDNTKLKEHLYHPSMVEFYPPSSDGLLGSPAIDAIRNPMAMRVLHTLRKQINRLIQDNIVDQDTRIVVETARELNDANWRWAIEAYQKQRDNENKEFEKLLKEFYPEKTISSSDCDKARLLIQQSKEYVKTVDAGRISDTTLKNYRMWLEQDGICIYTGEPITLSELLNDGCDIEHTIPRSLSFDDSLANKTICKADFNRRIKKNQIPTQLKNVSYKGKNVYEGIELRIQPWKEKVERLETSIKRLKEKSKSCQDKASKDECIRQRHLRELELEYWSKKVKTFTMTELTESFRNNQLNDTRTITKYAYHYLKTAFNYVSVQRGSTTAEFRKILGIQSQDEKKDRSLHSHHAIDASVLTLIPTEANKKKMLELYYEIDECKKSNHSYIDLENELKSKIEECEIPYVKNLTDFIQSNILVEHIVKDQVLTPSHRRLRRRGKVVYQEDGKTPIWLTGDTIRGQLHLETYYGAVKLPILEDNGKTIKRDSEGKIMTKDELKFVSRLPISNFSDKKWSDLEKAIVNKALIPMMQGQFTEGTSLKDAIARGIYMLKRDTATGEIVKVGKIRHIRCFAPFSSTLEIKNQTYRSDKDYKQKYYAASGDLPYMCKYEASDPKKKPLFVPYNLFELSMHIKQGGIPMTLTQKGIEYHLSQTLKKGDIILVFKDNVSELQNLGHADLIKRLYVIDSFTSDKRMYLYHINLSKSAIEGGLKAINFSNIQPALRTTMSSLKWLTLGKDFEFRGNEIYFFDK